MKRLTDKQRKKVIQISSVLGVSLLMSVSVVFFFINHAQFTDFFTQLNYCRIFLIFLIILFVICNFAFPRKKFYDFLWNKRYWVAGGVFAVLVALGISGSSMLAEGNFIQPNLKVQNGENIIGVSRAIRTDEYNVGVPATLSQINGNQPFAYFNDNLRGTLTNMEVAAGGSPILDIVSLAKPPTWGYFFLGAGRGYSFYWMSHVIGLFLVTLEFGMILTRKNRKLSVALAFLVTLAPAVSWWFMMSYFFYGELAFVLLFHYFSKRNSKLKKFIFATGLSVSMLGFALTLYPAWEIPLGLIFGTLGIVILIQKIRQKAIHKFDIFMLLYVLVFVGLVLLRFYLLNKDAMTIISQTVYPGMRLSTGGTGLEPLMNFASNLFYPFIPVGNPCEPSTFLSLFPIPIIFACCLLVYQIKTKKQVNPLFCVLVIFSIIFSWFVIFGFPEFLSKITLLFTVPGERMAVVVAYLCVCLVVMSIAQRKQHKINKKSLVISLIISLVYAGLILLLTYHLNESFMTKKIALIIFIFLFVFCLLFLLANHRRNKLFIVFIIAISIIGGATVNPVMCGINTYYDKPLAYNSKRINNEEPGKWIAMYSIIIQNYLVAQGLSTINSVNTYPNLDLLHKLDPEEKYQEVYNRYAHFSIEFTEQPTYFELIQPDLYILYINPQDLKFLDAKYIASSRQIDTKKYNLEEKYQEDGVYIYKIP